METPLWDFLQQYASRAPLRLHMPAHKGAGDLGVEQWDITEIEGVDPLYSGQGILWQSQQNAAALFGSAFTLYSVEGSSLCLRAMVALLVRYAQKRGVRPLLLATRNVHSAFLSALALNRAEVRWLYPAGDHDYTACPITAQQVADELDAMPLLPVALFVTSPDYLGNRQPLREIAEVCHQRGVLLAVDNAHGAYLHFIDGTHPLDLDADICCDSAHKTLPALTACAYLHVAKRVCFAIADALDAMRLFATTSPNFVQLASLDRLNAILDGWAPIAQAYASKTQAAKEQLRRLGYALAGDEPNKITLDALSYGYRGQEIAAFLRQKNIEVEMASDRYVVTMLSPTLPEDALARLVDALSSLARKNALPSPTIPACRPAVAMPVWQAVWSDSQTLPLAQCIGRIAQSAPCHCPPEVPAVMPGEIVDQNVVATLAALGGNRLNVVK